MSTYRVYQKKANKKGIAPIYISFYINREKIDVPTKLSVASKDFDQKRGLIKHSFEFSEDYNLIIKDIKTTINDIFVKYRLKDKRLTPELFRMEFRNPKGGKDFCAFCERSQKLRFQELSFGTQKNHRRCISALKEFKSKVYFDDLTTDFFRKFVLFLRNKRENKEVTIKKTIQTISIYLNEAVRAEYLAENPVHQLKLRGSQDTTAIALDEGELQRLVELHRTHAFYGTTHDVLEFFLFLCFSSLHISDAKALTIEQIKEDEFVYIRKKLRNVQPKVVHVPLSEPAKRIIAHQRGNRKKGILFENIISDQKINAHLKIVAKAAGITKKLCAKVGRHTFATLFLKNTRDLNTLKEIMGHSNLKQTLVYSHVLDEDRRTGIQIFNKFQ